MQGLRHVHLRSLTTHRLSNKLLRNNHLGCSQLLHRFQPWTRSLTRTSARLSQTNQDTHAAVPSPLPATSVPAQTWIDRAPAKLRPYLRLTRIDKPIGTLLLFYPCSASAHDLYLPELILCCLAWSITMASYAVGAPWTTPLTYISLFGIGALIMRSAGCTINDMADKDFDKAVGVWHLTVR